MARETASTVGHEAGRKGTETMSKNQTVVAEICLYGTRQTGAGYIVSIHTPFHVVRIGTGTPVSGRSFTEAVWKATDMIQLAGFVAGIVHVYEPTGHKFAAFRLEDAPCYYGDLKWTDGGIAYVIPSADVIAAAAL
jgi:hypothetical protein